MFSAILGGGRRGPRRADRGAAFRAALWLSVLAAAPAALAQPAAGAASPPRTVEDSIAERVRACTGCHGPQGRAAPDGYYPRIAGKPAGYLHHQLVAFRDGRRRYGLMTTLLTGLPDAYLREMAEHFAALEVPYPPPQPATAPAAVVERGRRLVREGDAARGLPACTACHGESMTGVQPAIPGLLGLPRDYLNAQLGAWRSGVRQALEPDCMARIAKALAPEDIGAISQYLAALPVVDGGHPAPVSNGARLARPMPCGGLPAVGR